MLPGMVPIVSHNIQSDPYFSNVTLLMHFDGPEGSTSFVDKSSTNLATTLVGAGRISTANSRFGGASFLANGLTALYSNAMPSTGTNLFTIEFWVYIAASQVGGTATYGLLDFRNSSTGTSPMFSISSANAMRVRIGNTDRWISDPLETEVWHHIALTRDSGNVFRFFINGIQFGSNLTLSQSMTSTWFTLASYCDQRNTSSGWQFAGNIDELRITSGVCRYTASFSPPAVAFADF